MSQLSNETREANQTFVETITIQAANGTSDVSQIVNDTVAGAIDWLGENVTLAQSPEDYDNGERTGCETCLLVTLVLCCCCSVLFSESSSRRY